VDKLKTEKRSGKNVQHDLDALFALPLTEFTAARNALATRLKKAGEPGDADRIKSLAKPSVAAWAVNQLFWKHRIAFDRLLDAGERFRNAQTAQLAGKSADLRAPLEARRAALSELSTHAAKILAEGGSAATPDTMRRVTTTLEALSTYAGIPDTPLPGRLTDDVQPPGFEALAALVPRVGSDRTGGPTRVIPFEFKQPSRKSARKPADEVDEKARAAERKAQIAGARAAIQEAERTLRDARKAAQKAEEELKKAAARAKEADAEKQKLEQQFETLTAQADEARKNARAVAAAAEGAAQEVEDAERALEKATRALESLNDD
jgi:DNA repair exonuclease SbcCD ATPase subunit